MQAYTRDFPVERNLTGRCALVTGSSSGIGLGIAKALAQRGSRLIIHGIEPVAQLEELATRLRHEYDVPVFAVSADLSREDQVRALVSRATELAGPIDILVNNAGIQHVASVESFEVAKWRQLLDIHLTAPFLLTQLLLPKMKERGWGRLVNIASVHGLIASAQKSAYVAAKHGLVGFTKTVALETAETGITSNAICPGWVRTPLVEAQIEARAQREGTDVETASRALLGEKQPSKRFVTVDQLGAMVNFLCSEAGSSMTGSVLTMDGGWTAQ